MKYVTKSLSVKNLIDSKYRSPTLLIDLSEVQSQYQQLKDGLPGAKVFYAMKSNPDEAVLRKMKSLGASFEVASIGELKRLEKIGVNLRKVIFSNPVKAESHIKEAFRMKIHSYAYDSPEEIETIAKNAPRSKVYLGVSVTNRGSLIDLSSKFGADSEHAIALLGSAIDKGLKPIGLTFHVGSQAENLSVWDSAISTILPILKQAKQQGFNLKIVNIGGGMPIQYSEASPDVEEVFTRIRRAIRKLPNDIEIWCEPGRFIVGTSGTLIANVVSKSFRANDEWLYLDVGRFQAFVEMFESEEIHLPVLTDSNLEGKDVGTKMYTLTGPTCDAYDTIYKEIELPQGIKTGDKLYFLKAGAYTTVYGSAFNDFPVPKTVIIE